MAPVVRYLVLWLTTGCNLNCSYCYRGEDNSPQLMSVKVAEKALRLAATSGLPFHVQLAGGEPTLATQMIYDIARHVRASSLPATLGLQTNGTLINGRFIDIVRHFDIQLGISLDGPPEVQEIIRGGAKETLRGLRLLADNGIEFRVTTVVTDQNVNYLSGLVLMLAGFPNARGIGLDLLVTKGRATQGSICHPSGERFRAGLIEFLRTLEATNARREFPIQFRELERVRRTMVAQEPGAYCYACRGESMAVLPDGRIYPCSQTAGDPQFASGTVEKPCWERLCELGDHRLHGTSCPSCPLEIGCPGDCPSRQFYNDHISKSLACVMYKTLWSHGNLAHSQPSPRWMFA